MKDLLLEIGCENLPPHAIRPAFEQLERDAGARLGELRLSYESIYTTGSSRRLVLIVRGLAEAQTSKSETVTGPPVARAFDENGKPTKAAVGFARSHGLDPGDLRRIESERGWVVGFTRRLKTQRATSLLKTALPELIAGLRFPKTMRWESGGVRFARPIRWLVCLFGDRPLGIALAGVRSGAATHTVPWIRRDRIAVKSPGRYAAALRKVGVIVDHEDRADAIRDAARRTAKRAGLRLVEDEALFDELTFMVEAPRILMGSFDQKYLMLPPEVVVTAMKSHQRFLAMEDGRGRLVPKFLTFTEGAVGSPALVRKGNEKVLRARLEDALFYWHEDLKTGLDGLSEKLGAIVFIEGLGSLRDKAERVFATSVRINEALAPDTVDDSLLRRATLLAKADLASEMVKDGKEFTLLEGLIGSRYAREAGEPVEIVTALAEQYKPRTPADELPRSPLGILLGMADRIDTITGCFGAGLVPTGSQDPYALRRQANGLLRIAVTLPTVSIAGVLDGAVAAYRDQRLLEGVDPTDLLRTLGEFFRQRVETFLKDQDIAYDVVAAVSAVAWANPALALARAAAVQAQRGDAGFERLITGAKRVGNILSPETKLFGVSWDVLIGVFAETTGLPNGARFQSNLFEDEAERGLHSAIRETIPKMQAADAEQAITATLELLSGLGRPIDRYFDEVLVNCPDENLKKNRHDFLAAVFAIFSRYADFSHIVEEGKVAVGGRT